MDRDAADQQVHAVRQAVAVAAGLDELAAPGQLFEQTAQRTSLLARYLETLLQFAGGRGVLHPVADHPQELLVIQHLPHLTVPASNEIPTCS